MYVCMGESIYKNTHTHTHTHTPTRGVVVGVFVYFLPLVSVLLPNYHLAVVAAGRQDIAEHRVGPRYLPHLRGGRVRMTHTHANTNSA